MPSLHESVDCVIGVETHKLSHTTSVVAVLFTTAMGLLATLGKALTENRLEERLKVLAQPQLLIIDEIGYISIDRQGANLFFQLISRRSEKGSILQDRRPKEGALAGITERAAANRYLTERFLRLYPALPRGWPRSRDGLCARAGSGPRRSALWPGSPRRRQRQYRAVSGSEPADSPRLAPLPLGEGHGPGARVSG